MKQTPVHFIFQTEENEQINTVIQVQEEPRSVIIGVVVNEQALPICNAVVLLYLHDIGNSEVRKPIACTFTGVNGDFCFGPLCIHTKYLIQVWTSHMKFREIVIKPETHSSCNDSNNLFDCHCLGNIREYIDGEMATDNEI